MALRITTAHYAANAMSLQPFLLTQARQYGLPLQDAEDVVQEAIQSGLNALETYDHRSEAGLAGWLHKILTNRALSHLRQLARKQRHEIPWSDTNVSISDERWASLESDNARALLADAELRATARARMRVAPLSPLEAECLAYHLDGEPQSSIAAITHHSKTTVNMALRSARLKLQRSTVESMESPDFDWFWLTMLSAGTIYRRPSKLGARLAREKQAKLR